MELEVRLTREDGSQHHGHTLDLSRGGAGLKVPMRPWPKVGENFELLIDLSGRPDADAPQQDGMSDTLKLTAEVKWLAVVVPGVMGVRFSTPIDEQTGARLGLG